MKKSKPRRKTKPLECWVWFVADEPINFTATGKCPPRRRFVDERGAAWDCVGRWVRMREVRRPR